MVEPVAGLIEVKTSACAEPVAMSVVPRLKTNSQVLPCQAAGTSNVTSVVISGVVPVFEMRPCATSKLIAPVHTLYVDVTVGKIVEAEEGLGTGVGAAKEEVAPKMAAAIAAVNFILIGGMRNWSRSDSRIANGLVT